jgi:hypothetical protein
MTLMIAILEAWRTVYMILIIPTAIIAFVGWLLILNGISA